MQRHQTIVLVELRTALALDFTEQVLVLDQGGVVLDNRSPDLLDKHVGLASTKYA